MIAKLETKLSNAQQNMYRTQSSTKQWRHLKRQWINNNRTIVLGCSAEVIEGLSYFYCQIFALDSAVVKPGKFVKLAWRLPYLSNVSSWGNNQIYKHTVMNHRTWLSTHRQSKLHVKKTNPSWDTVGPAKDKHQALTQRWKFYSRVVFEPEVLPTVNCIHFILQMTCFFVQRWLTEM